MPRIPNKAVPDASSIWHMNDVYRAENGGEWPDSAATSLRQPRQVAAKGVWNMNEQRNAVYGQRWPILPPTYADGYVSRTTGLTDGDASPASVGINNWGGFYVNPNYYHALSIRCTTNDWELDYWSIGNANNQGGVVYQEFQLWESQYVNDVPNILPAYTQIWGFWIPNNGTPAGQTMQYNSGGHGNSTPLTQNQWYTMGMAYTQGSVHSYSAYPAFYLDGGGYGTSVTTKTFTCSASNAVGTTNVTATFEWANPLGVSSTTAPWTSDMGLTNINNGQFVTTGVRLIP